MEKKPLIPTHFLREMLRLILKKNIFHFNGIQTDGTAMGTKMAVSFANIFMAEVETDIVNRSPYKRVFPNRRPKNEDLRPYDLKRRPCDLKRRPTDLKRRPCDLKQRPYDLKRRSTDLKRRPADLKRRPSSKMSERCQADYGWSDDIVCYGIVGTVEQWNK